MSTIDWVSADSDKACLCWLWGKDNRMVICTVFIFEIKGPVVYLILGTNTAEWSQKSVKSLVLIYQQLWYFALRREKRICLIFRPMSLPSLPVTSLSVNTGIILSDGIFILNNWSWLLWKVTSHEPEQKKVREQLQSKVTLPFHTEP